VSTSRTKVRRGSKRAVYEQDEIYRILDDNLLCQVGFAIDGEARIIPTAYIRVGDAVYLHGNRQNQMMNALLDGQTACISVTEMNGLVLARSGFHHSVNYRSVTLFGKARIISDNKVEILDAFVDRLVPGRSGELRPNTRNELDATLVLEIPIEEAVAKVRTGPPIDDDADYELDIWAGVLPIETGFGIVEDCPRLKPGTVRPSNVSDAASATS
jgi:nitroimidazol reductase NimA-like FMN-containing flavoprotein (pyridoxamine 5'-phosphate oxidase superfamily)